MNKESIFSKAFTAILILVIIVILSMISFMIFRSLEKRVKADIFLYTHELEEQVRRMALAEYKRYLLLGDMGETLDPDLPEGELRRALESKADLFSPGGGFPRMISSLGYFSREEEGPAYELNVESREWQAEEKKFIRRKARGRIDVTYARSAEGRPEIYLILNRTGDRGLFLKLDNTGFINTYIKEKVEMIDGDLTYQWLRKMTLLQDTPRLRRGDPGPEGYTFHPFQTLLGIGGEKTPLFVEIPAFFITEERELPPEGKNEHPPLLPSGIFVRIQHPQGAYFYPLERRAAVNFLESLGLLMVFGLLFFLLIRQLHKTRLLRRKEREFVASVTHELRTPLTVIHSAADNLSTGIVPTEKIKTYAALIDEQSQRLGQMIEEILLYSEMESRRSSPESPEEMDLRNLISQNRKVLDYMARSRGMDLHWDMSGLPQRVKGYPGLLSLTLNNLVTNAIHHAYSQPPPPTEGEGSPLQERPIRIQLRYLIPGKLRLTVEDDGRGIDPRELKQIFQPFYRDTVSRQEQEKGSGLGLFITRRKASLAGGTLTVESPYRRIDGSRHSGCRFTMTLPGTIPEGSFHG